MNARGKAPECSHAGCTRPTWDGLCWQHVGGNVSGATATLSVPTLSSQTPLVSYAEAWVDTSAVFTDIDDVVTIDSIRDQVRATVTASVSLEAYRNFRYIDVADPNQRNQMAVGLRNAISDQLRPAPVMIGRGDAIDLVNSSSDEYGRSAEDSAGLIGYGLTKEWQIGQHLTAGATSPDGTHYSNGVDDFITVVGTGEIQELINQQFGRELSRFDTIISETTGRHAKNQAPFYPGLVVNEDTVAIESSYYAEQRAREIAEAKQTQAAQVLAQRTRDDLIRAEQQRAIDEVARKQRGKGILRNVALLAGSVVLDTVLDTDGSRADRHDRKVAATRDQEWDKLRQSWQREADDKRDRRNRRR